MFFFFFIFFAARILHLFGCSCFASDFEQWDNFFLFYLDSGHVWMPACDSREEQCHQHLCRAEQLRCGKHQILLLNMNFRTRRSADIFQRYHLAYAQTLLFVSNCVLLVRSQPICEWPGDDACVREYQNITPRTKTNAEMESQHTFFFYFFLFFISLNK